MKDFEARTHKQKKSEKDYEAENQDLENRGDKIINESLESTRRMIQLCEESRETGIRSIVALDDQGEQLEQTEKGMDKVNKDMKEAEKHMSGMEQCCGICAFPCGKKSEFKENSKTWNKNHDDGVISHQPTRVVDQNGMVSYGGFIAKITNDAREVEMDENLVQVSSMVVNLRNMSIDMGFEITNQNRQMDRINEKTESNEIRVCAANARAGKMLRN